MRDKKNRRITPKIVEHTARLAHLELTEEQRANLPAELTKIIGYVSKLQEIDTAGVEETAHPTGGVNAWTEDEAIPCADRPHVSSFTSPKP